VSGLILLALHLLTVWLHWRIAARAGYRPAWALLTLVPILNLVLIWWFAFAPWPGQRRAAPVPPPPPPPPSAAP